MCLVVGAVRVQLVDAGGVDATFPVRFGLTTGDGVDDVLGVLLLAPGQATGVEAVLGARLLARVVVARSTSSTPIMCTSAASRLHASCSAVSSLSSSSMNKARTPDNTPPLVQSEPNTPPCWMSVDRATNTSARPSQTGEVLWICSANPLTSGRETVNWYGEVMVAPNCRLRSTADCTEGLARRLHRTCTAVWVVNDGSPRTTVDTL